MQGKPEGPGKGQSSTVHKDSWSQAQVNPSLYFPLLWQPQAKRHLYNNDNGVILQSINPSSISHTTATERQARAERIEKIQAELEQQGHQISTLGQQVDQYQHACSRAKEEQDKLR